MAENAASAPAQKSGNLHTSPSYTASYRVVLDESKIQLARIVDVIASTGAAIRGLDVVDSEFGLLKVDITADTRDSEHRRQIKAALAELEGVELRTVADQTFLAHVGGKLHVEPKQWIRSRDDLSRVYTPGVARVCQAIADDPQKAYGLTVKSNSVAVLTDGTAVLGMGDIGPVAALPVMEGKAVLFKQFGGVDAWPVCVDTKDTEEIIKIAKAIAPAYGGINLEDISAPRCFEIEERLREELDIPVFHDDQHGTAIVVLAALINALKLTGKKIEDVRIVVSGVGAAGTAIIKLLMAQGARNIIAYGRSGALRADAISEDMPTQRRWLSENTNPERFSGTMQEALVGSDVFIGVSKGNILTGEDVAQMAPNSIVFALANPIPEVDPFEAGKHAAVVATGRSDYPNQINNVLAFPGLFRGIFDAKINQITDELLRVTANAIASVISESELAHNYIIPNVFDKRVPVAVSEAVQKAAAGLPRWELPRQEDTAMDIKVNLPEIG